MTSPSVDRPAGDLPKPVSSVASPGVSVIIPAYNYARFLPEAVESALRQDYPNFEVIVVNDGSTDETPQILAGYGERIRAIHQANAGLPAARNTGIRAARFPFVAFLDADDVWLPGMLRSGMETFARLSDDFAIVACDDAIMDAGGAPRPARRFDSEWAREITIHDILLQTRFSPSAVIAKKAALEECGGFDPALRSSEDRDMWVRMAARRRVFRTADVHVRIRKHGANMSAHADRMKANMIRVIQKAWRERLVPRRRFWFWLQVIAFHHFQTAVMFNGAGRSAAAFRDLLVSALCWPWFPNATRLNQPAFFRLRRLVRFTLDALRGGPQP
ncbi:MAG: glycosyltransferase family 2 protein [Verrucomicrobia bacterium]|nr:glycosyltransferase family 2 protein [Verrucomicrobiota bacterium]